MCLWTTQRHGLFTTASLAEAVWDHTVLHRWMGAYERHIAPEQHQVGKQHTQKIESKHINLRTRIKRLVRRTICFSKTTTMHNLVIGLFINRYEFGLLICMKSTALKHLRFDYSPLHIVRNMD